MVGQPVFLQGKKQTHKHKRICRIVPGLGGCQKCVCVFFFFGSFLMGDKKHINKIPPKMPGQSRENVVYVFFLFMCFCRSLFLPRTTTKPDEKFATICVHFQMCCRLQVKGVGRGGGQAVLNQFCSCIIR